MQSVTTTVPSSVENSVSSTRVAGRYRRFTCAFLQEGAIRQCPFSSAPSSAAKHEAESNRGKESQSIDPLFATRAAVEPFPINA
jgi:hypothetical protein